jgi:hypothetical protein
MLQAMGATEPDRLRAALSVLREMRTTLADPDA